MKKKKILVIGGVTGGASAAARIRRKDESAEIIILEKGPHVSFSNCSLPFYLSGTIANSERLILVTPDKFQKQYNIQVRINNEAVKINRAEKKVLIRDNKTGREYEESYDKLVLSPGASPVLPGSIDGIQSEHVFTIRNVTDIEQLKLYIDQNHIQDIAVVGGGFIGIEAAENLRLTGRNVSIIEALDQVMAPFDYDMAQLLHKELTDNGIRLILGDGVKRITADTVELASGRKIPAGAVIMAVGVKPETTLARDAGLEIGATGGIKVNYNYQTNDKDIYAVGDAIEVYHKLTHTPTRLTLAGPAQRQARAAADHIYGASHRNTGVIGSSVVRIFNLNAASTGLNEKAAQNAGIPYEYVYTISPDKVGLMPDSHPMHFKLLFEVPTGKILGAQAIGAGNTDKRIDVIASLISMGGTLDDLKELELCYSPMFGTARDILNLAALVGLNILHGDYRQVHVSNIRRLVEENACIIDVRERNEYENGHLINAVNIPLSELRERMNEIPKDIPVYLHCRSGQRSYNAVMALQNSGYTNVINVSGSFLGICCYEYYNDLAAGRKKIVTEYNFR